MRLLSLKPSPRSTSDKKQLQPGWWSLLTRECLCCCRWDSETIGCEPSLSSIPVKDQRTLTSALEEVRDWLDRPGNEREFVVMFFDDQEDLQAWVSTQWVPRTKA